MKKEPLISSNIAANVGSINNLKFQDNGTNRLKGSYPKLINNSQQILDHLQQSVPLLLKKKPSRLCSRYFTTTTAIQNIDKIINNKKISGFNLKVEAKVPLGKIKRLNNQEIYWVWIGGNIKDRGLDPILEQEFLNKIHQPSNNLKSYFKEMPKDYRFVLLGTKNRINQLQTNEVPEFVKIEEINENYANQIADLYAKRMPVYIAPNDNPSYIINTVANSDETVLLAGINTKTNQVEAVMANEFTRYPLENTTINICESNDWIKKWGIQVPREVLFTILNIGMVNALNHQIDGIEVECVPESIEIAKNIAGFEPTEHFLKRTSYMITDGKNIESSDTTIPSDFRKYNSLFLFYITPPTHAWRFWKKLGQKTT